MHHKTPNKAPSVASEIITGLTEFAEALENQEVISEKFTCKKVILDLRPTPHGPKQVKQIRKLLNLSQALFARFLGVSPKTVRAWEQGVNPPPDIACRIMDEIQRDPEYWRNRLRELVVAR